MIRLFLAGAVFLFPAGAVLAQSCSGVEKRVNTETSSLTTTLTAEIESLTEQIVAQETAQRNELLSALRVGVRQEALSAEQEASADNAAQLGMANVIVEDSVAAQVHDVVTDYGTTGHAACELVEAGNTIAEMVENYAKVRADLALAISESRNAKTEEEFRDQMAEWSTLVGDADDATVASLLSGDKDAANAFIAVVAGPPRWPEEAGGGTSVLARMDRVEALREEARNASAVFALSDLAAAQGLREALDEQADLWLGEDGGEAWAARMASSSTRSVLLDTARIEAHIIASTALELRQSVMNEFALAVFALAHIDQQRKLQAQARTGQ